MLEEDRQGLKGAIDAAGCGAIVLRRAADAAQDQPVQPSPGPSTPVQVEVSEELVKLNVLAPVRLVHAAIPQMIERGEGTIVTFASQLVFTGTADMPQLPRRVVYTASKAFLFTFIRLLALELRDTGVRLQVVCPGVVKTEFHTRQNLDVSHMPRLEPEAVIQASMLGLERGELVCIPTLQDAELLSRRDQAEIDIFTAGMRPELAGRYSTS